MLDEISAALARIEDEGSFATRSSCPSDDLRLEVGGVGPIRFPVSAASARKLCKVARPAAHGRGTRTLTDPKVRDTWEIVKSRVKIDRRRWNRTLEPPSRCGCELCQELAGFLRDPDRVELRWPLAKQRRRHIHTVIDGHGLPLSHTTECSGSPHKLVLRKQRTLFQRDAARRTRQRTLLRALAGLRRQFTAT